MPAVSAPTITAAEELRAFVLDQILNPRVEACEVCGEPKAVCAFVEECEASRRDEVRS